MTKEERTRLIKYLKYNRSIGADYLITDRDADEIIKALEQQPCEDAISRQAVLEQIDQWAIGNREYLYTNATYYLTKRIQDIPPVNPTKTGHCKDCKYFEYDSVAKVDGIPLIVAHEICKRWGDGCKTKENGYCFMFEPQERSDKG